jgi:hypothetical protein
MKRKWMKTFSAPTFIYLRPSMAPLAAPTFIIVPKYHNHNFHKAFSDIIQDYPKSYEWWEKLTP